MSALARLGVVTISDKFYPQFALLHSHTNVCDFEGL